MFLSGTNSGSDISDVTLEENTARQGGGAIAVEQSAIVQMNKVIAKNNKVGFDRWIFKFKESQSISAASKGTTVTQGTSVGTSEAITSNSVLITSHVGITFLDSADLVVGETTIEHDNIDSVEKILATSADYNDDDRTATGGFINSVFGSPILIRNSVLDGNEADSSGGAVHVAATSIAFSNVAISNSKSLLGNGGAINAVDGAEVHLSKTTMDGNTALQGGGGHSKISSSKFIVHDAGSNFEWPAYKPVFARAHKLTASSINEWTLAVLNTPTIAETAGVTVSQGGVDKGTLKTILSGAATSVVIETASGVTILADADVTIGTTVLVAANIDTAINNGATGTVMTGGIAKHGGSIAVTASDSSDIVSTVLLNENNLPVDGKINCDSSIYKYNDGKDNFQACYTNGVYLGSGSVITKSEATGSRGGGAVHAVMSYVKMNGASIKESKASKGSGGGIALEIESELSMEKGKNGVDDLDGTMTYVSSSIKDNVADVDGGGVFCQSCSTIGMKDSTKIEGNKATIGSGGALYIWNMEDANGVSSQSTVFDNNQCHESGGAVSQRLYITYISINITNIFFSFFF